MWRVRHGSGGRVSIRGVGTPWQVTDVLDGSLESVARKGNTKLVFRLRDVLRSTSKHTRDQGFRSTPGWALLMHGFT